MKKIEAIGSKNGNPETLWINFPSHTWIKIIPKYEGNIPNEDKRVIKLGMQTNYTISLDCWKELQTYLDSHGSLVRIDTTREDLYYISLDKIDLLKILKEETQWKLLLANSTTLTIEKEKGEKLEKILENYDRTKDTIRA